MKISRKMVMNRWIRVFSSTCFCSSCLLACSCRFISHNSSLYFLQYSTSLSYSQDFFCMLPCELRLDTSVLFPSGNEYMVSTFSSRQCPGILLPKKIHFKNSIMSFIRAHFSITSFLSISKNNLSKDKLWTQSKKCFVTWIFCLSKDGFL